ncbi:MAG: hypothetical protein QG649_375 [Patescibacteria group bacterium]|jgi:RNA polymerase sigma factor (sigma-70 family)|nr:hypothetical protein [Patescibacteria group bacterium]
MSSERHSPESVLSPDYAFAGSLQATLNNIHSRDFSLDVQQLEALEAIGHALVTGTKSGYIEMATSTGKTTVEALLAEAAVRAGKRVLLLAPTIPIARQIVGKNNETPTGLRRFAHLPDGTSVHSHFGSSTGNESADIVVTTYPGLLNDAKRGHQTLGQFDVAIADECHRSLGEQTSQVIRTAFPDAFKLGLSATPDYAIDRMSNEVFDQSLYDFSLIQAIETGKTAPVRTLVYETNESLQLTDPRREFTDRELAPLIENMQRNNTALELSRALVEEGRQGIIACVPGQSNLHARLLADLLKTNGVKAAAVGAHLSPEDHALKLKMFDAGVFDVLTFTKSLEEGWDSDKASFAINLSPTTSPVRTKQLLGRVLRKKPSGIESIYVDFIDEKSGLSKSQYTAMHALDLDYIDFDRVLGRHGGSQGPYRPHPGMLHFLNPKLLERLKKSQGKLLQDVTVGQQIDPLVKLWETTLADEGLPAELNDNFVLPPRLEKRVSRAYTQFVRDNQTEPTVDDLIEIMGTVSNPERIALGKFALRVEMTPNHQWDLEDVPASDDLSDQTQIAEKNALYAQLNAVTNTLSEREAGVIDKRFGLTNGEPMDLDKIGKEYGVTREHIRQIESKSMSKLRHPSRSEVLKDYLDISAPYGHMRASDSRPEVSVKIPMAKLFDYIDSQLANSSETGAREIYNSLVALGIDEFADLIDTSTDNLKTRLPQVKVQRINILDSYIEAADTQLHTQRARSRPDETSIATIERRRKNLTLAREIITRIKFAQ